MLLRLRHVNVREYADRPDRLLQLVELVFRVVPEQGPAVFTSMLPNIFKSIAEDQVQEGLLRFAEFVYKNTM